MVALSVVSWAPDYLITAQYPDSLHQVARPPAPACWQGLPLSPFETEEVRSWDFYDDAAKVWIPPPLGAARSSETVDSLDIGSFAKAGQPQAMPSVMRASPPWRHLRHKGVVISTIPYAGWRPWLPLPQSAPTDRGGFSLDEPHGNS